MSYSVSARGFPRVTSHPDSPLTSVTDHTITSVPVTTIRAQSGISASGVLHLPISLRLGLTEKARGSPLGQSSGVSACARKKKQILKRKMAMQPRYGDLSSWQDNGLGGLRVAAASGRDDQDARVLELER